jgi:hypothetical protein
MRMQLIQRYEQTISDRILKTNMLKTMAKSFSIYVILAFAISILISFGCKKEEDVIVEKPTPEPVYTITATIDSGLWIGVENKAAIKDGFITIQAISEELDTLDIIIHGESIGVYEFSQFTDSKAYFIDTSFVYSSDAYSSSSGTVVITDINTVDSTISGSFYFELFDVEQSGWRISITEGQITELKTVFYSNLTTEFKATIDGNPWTGITNTATVTDSLITINSIDGAGGGFAISIYSEYPGTFTLDQNSEHVASYSNGSGVYMTNSDSMAGGQVIIYEINTIDSVISGMFFFKVYDTLSGTYKEITEGSFNKIDFSILQGGGSGTMTMDVDGISWLPEIVSGLSSYGILNLSGADLGTSKTISFRLPLSIAAGTYSLPFEGNFTVMFTKETNDIYMATDGWISIIKHDTATNEIEGTFEFEGNVLALPDSTIQITNGSFNINYIE